MEKYFDAKDMRNVIDDIEWLFSGYREHSDGLISCYEKYRDNELFQGELAEASKQFIDKRQITQAKAQVAMQQKLLGMYKHALSSFHEKVDTAPDARVDLETLTIVNKDLQDIYADLDEYVRYIEKVVKLLQARYGFLGVFTMPNFQPALDTFTALCGGDNPRSGFIYDLKQKFINFDADECAYADSLNFEQEIDDANNRIQAATNLLDSYSTEGYKRDVSIVKHSEKKNEKINNVSIKNAKSKFSGISHDMVEKYSSNWNIELGDDEWTTADILYWKTKGGDDFLFKKKSNYIKKYNDVIKDAAKKYDIPEILLAGIVFNEFGGDPLWIDDVAYNIRAFDWSGNDTIDKMTITKRPELTSFGNLSIQVRRVAEMYGYDPKNLTFDQAKEIIADLKDPVKSIYIAAAHLSDLRNIDYAGVPLENLDDAMIRDIATRYNRGPDISLDEVHKDTSYGDCIFLHKEEIVTALED